MPQIIPTIPTSFTTIPPRSRIFIRSFLGSTRASSICGEWFVKLDFTSHARRRTRLHVAGLGPTKPAQGKAEGNTSPQQQYEQTPDLTGERSSFQNGSAQGVIERG